MQYVKDKFEDMDISLGIRVLHERVLEKFVAEIGTQYAQRNVKLIFQLRHQLLPMPDTQTTRATLMSLDIHTTGRRTAQEVGESC